MNTNLLQCYTIHICRCQHIRIHKSRVNKPIPADQKRCYLSDPENICSLTFSGLSFRCPMTTAKSDVGTAPHALIAANYSYIRVLPKSTTLTGLTSTIILRRSWRSSLDLGPFWERPLKSSCQVRLVDTDIKRPKIIKFRWISFSNSILFTCFLHADSSLVKT